MQERYRLTDRQNKRDGRPARMPVMCDVGLRYERVMNFIYIGRDSIAAHGTKAAIT